MTTQREQFKKIIVSFSVNVVYKLKWILNTIIRHLITKLKIDPKSHVLYEKFIQEHYNHNEINKKSFIEKTNILKEKNKKIDEFISRFVRKFVFSIQEFHSLPFNLGDSHNILVYCSIIKESNIASKKGRVLQVIPYNKESKNIVHHSFKNIQFHTLEYLKISEIHILLTDMYGNKIRFMDSYTPTNLTLTFKSFK